MKAIIRTVFSPDSVAFPGRADAADIETEARELHKTSCVGWMRWNQLSKPCQEEFRQNAQKKLGAPDSD